MNEEFIQKILEQNQMLVEKINELEKRITEADLKVWQSLKKY